jgi:hypothetical protein
MVVGQGVVGRAGQGAGDGLAVLPDLVVLQVLEREGLEELEFCLVGDALGLERLCAVDPSLVSL